MIAACNLKSGSKIKVRDDDRLQISPQILSEFKGIN